MLVAGNLEGANVPLSWGGAALGGRREATGRHLLAGEHRLRRDEVVELLGIRDRARDDAAADDLGLLEQALPRDVRAGGPDRNVALRDEDGNVRLALRTFRL